MEAAISIRNLRKTYRLKNGTQKEALKGITLEVPQGSMFALLGPNGAGKSTIINILAGLVNKTSGTASVCGYDIDTDTQASKFALGVVPQELVLDPFFTVKEALENHAGYYGLQPKQRRTDEIIAALGLTEKANAPARSLSGGMRRRLLVGKALVHNPKVLILDEPTAGVDVELREQLWAYVQKLHSQGTTILLTTHYLEEAEKLCDYVAVINHGELVANDKKSALLKLLDQKQLSITLDQAMTEVPASLQKYEANITPEGKLVVKYHAAKTSVDEILQPLIAANLSIRDLSTQEAHLEDIFKHLTKAA